MDKRDGVITLLCIALIGSWAYFRDSGGPRPQPVSAPVPIAASASASSVSTSKLAMIRPWSVIDYGQMVPHDDVVHPKEGVRDYGPWWTLSQVLDYESGPNFKLLARIGDQGRIVYAAYYTGILDNFVPAEKTDQINRAIQRPNDNRIVFFSANGHEQHLNPMQAFYFEADPSTVYAFGKGAVLISTPMSSFRTMRSE